MAISPQWAPPASAQQDTAQEAGAPLQKEVVDTSPEGWAKRIVALLPSGPIAVEPIQPSFSDLQGAPPSTLRWAAQDILSERLNLDRDRVIAAYADAANSQNIEMDMQLATLYSVTGPAGSRTDFENFETFLTSKYWFVAASAEIEIARHLSYQQRAEDAEQAIKRALLKLPETGEPALIREAYYNIAIIAQLLSMNASNLDTAFAASTAVLRLAIELDRLIDRHTIVFNLAQVHGATFDFEATEDITRPLLDYSLELDEKRTLLGLYLYGVTLFESGQAAKSLPYFAQAEALNEKVDDPRFATTILQFRVRALAADGQDEKAKAVFDRLQILDAQMGGGSISTDMAQAALLAAQGQSDEAFALESTIRSRILSAYSKSMLQPREILRMDGAFLEPESSPERQLITIDIAERGRNRGIDRILTRGLSRDAYRDLRALEVELTLYAADRTWESQTQTPPTHAAVLDAFFGRSQDLPRAAALKFRRNIIGDDPNALAMANLFDTFLTARSAREPLPPPNPSDIATLRAWTWLLRSRLALEQDRMATAYRALEEARYITLRYTDTAQAIQYDLSDQDLTLAALEGNPNIALQAALTHVQAARDRNRTDPLFVVMSGAISALERAGHTPEALALADIFYAQSQSQDSRFQSFAAYTKGRLLYKMADYDRAVLFLSAAQDTLTDPELEPLIMRVRYAALAGADRPKLAADANKQLRLTLARRNDATLSQMTTPYIAHAEALLASGELPLRAEAGRLWQDWAEAEMTAEHAQWQTQAELATLRAKSISAVMASETQANQNYASQLDKRQAATQRLGLLFLLSAIAFLIGLGYLLYRLRQLRRLQRLSAQASVVKGQFLNMIGHEARIRLQGISSFADSLKASSISLEHLPTVQVISAQASSLSQAISDLIASARILSGDGPDKSDLFVAEDLRLRVIESAPEFIGKRDVTLSFEIAPNVTPVLIERRYIVTAVERLVKLAIKNTRAGTVEVRLSLEKSLRGPRLNVVVEDTGSGMTPSEIDSLMTIFEQDGSGVSRIVGTDALDLPLAHQAILALGGIMQVHSEVGEGTRISLSVPVRRAAANDTSDTTSIQTLRS